MGRSEKKMGGRAEVRQLRRRAGHAANISQQHRVACICEALTASCTVCVVSSHSLLPKGVSFLFVDVTSRS